MRTLIVSWMLAFAGTAGWAQGAQGPSNPKAQKTYAAGVKALQDHKQPVFALEDFEKADKQDGGKCNPCQQKIVSVALSIDDFKSAEQAAQAMIAEATDPVSVALAHNERGVVLLREAVSKKKDDLFTEADEEFQKAIASDGNFPVAVYYDGVTLAHLKRDDAAKAQFLHYLALTKGQTLDRVRAQRYVERPELARARMAPPFSLTTLDGQKVALDSLTGKVVLIDFWATWCGPCREALPHLQEISRKFQDQPLVILSVSLDSDETRWKTFVAKNKMTWLQYRDGAFGGPMAKLFDVQAIPSTFTIDMDGVLQDQHVGDASIDSKLKKLCAHASEPQDTEQEKAKTGQ